jgi:hypothetical protein
MGTAWLTNENETAISANYALDIIHIKAGDVLLNIDIFN